MCGAVLPLPQYAFMAQLEGTQEQLYLFLLGDSIVRIIETLTNCGSRQAFHTFSQENASSVTKASKLSAVNHLTVLENIINK
jgi:hypothetical protein